ncbi:hypothetical protein [Methylococcus sp. EFPC2]|uniref:c-type cytochrome n=1 Tax=Methylococcus sp. EFPC2 TaxID=2812648 RepID=UPI0019675432|nr:hypothetical protein [Methylococcus sp. EFPC2]QSA97924.1 hypothetical protein JWZ97_03595 [Methylococcus sp. EFPC2]
MEGKKFPIGLLLVVSLVIMPPAARAQTSASLATRPGASTLAHACAGCHGTYGHSQAGTPAIAGMKEADFIQAMRAFASGQRVSSIMNRIARGYRDEDYAAMARFFAAH